jgi:hypothetical protein
VDVLATFQGEAPRTETVASGVEVLMVLGRSGMQPSMSDVGLDAAVAGIGAGSATLILLVPSAEQARVTAARAGASLDVSIAPPEDD